MVELCFFLIIVIEYRLVLQKGFKFFFLFNRTLLTSLHLLIDNSEWTDILKFVVSRKLRFVALFRMTNWRSFSTIAE